MSAQAYIRGYMLIGACIGGIIIYIRTRLENYRNIRRHRKQAVKQSSAVILGQVKEKIAPLLPNFPYHYKDMTFLGKGVDYIVFDGLHTGKVNKVVFIEIKTGRSRLNKNERAIQEAIKAGRTSYQIIRL